MPTIYDVAEHCKVSPATVSLVLNGSPRKVSEHTRQRVRDAARDLNYRPSAIARRLTRKRMDALGIFLPSVANQVFGDLFFGPIANAVFGQATERGQCLTVFPRTIVNELDRCLSVLTDGRIDGLLLLVPGLDPAIKEGLISNGLPCVEIGATPGPPGISVVDCDNELGGYLATRHLIDLGHRRIATITGHDSYVATELRLRGYKRALAEAGLEERPDLVFGGRFTRDSGYEATKSWLKGNTADRPTAIFAGDDLIAYGAMDAATECGVSIPQELSIVGFDDFATSATCAPSLSSICPPLVEMGCVAVDLLMSIIGEDCPCPEQRIFAPELVVRQSSGPVPPNV